jgi:hypothetical protein
MRKAHREFADNTKIEKEEKHSAISKTLHSWQAVTFMH